MVLRGGLTEDQQRRVDNFLKIAVDLNDVEQAQKMVLLGANVNGESKEEGKHLLHLACGGGYVEIAKLLIDHRANLEIRDNDGISSRGGWTPLMYAIANYKFHPAKSFAIIKYLLQNGANPNRSFRVRFLKVYNQENLSYLDIAEEMNLPVVVAELKKYMK
jgi:ankyrin repeat protein